MMDGDSEGPEKMTMKKSDRRASEEGLIELDCREAWRSRDKVETMAPTFNADRLFFTPAFVLPVDKKYYSQNQTFERFQFRERIERNLECHLDLKNAKGLDNIKQAAPNSNYCQICKQNYENYFSHTQLSNHLQKAQSSLINKDIRQLCQTFKDETKLSRKKPKSKGIKKQMISQKMEKKEKNKEFKEEWLQIGCEYFPKSGNQSTGVGWKDSASGNLNN